MCASLSFLLSVREGKVPRGRIPVKAINPQDHRLARLKTKTPGITGGYLLLN